jgi:hypothetical protein
VNFARRDPNGFNEASVPALCGFYRRMLVVLAREMDDAPDAWVREAIGEWLDEFVQESTNWSEPSKLRSAPPLSRGAASGD